MKKILKKKVIIVAVVLITIVVAIEGIHRLKNTRKCEAQNNSTEVSNQNLKIQNDKQISEEQTFVKNYSAISKVETITGIGMESNNRIITIQKIGNMQKIDCNSLYDDSPTTGYTFTSLDTNVATVDENGIITAESIGSTVIRIYNSENEKYSSVRVKVLGEGNMALPKIAAGFNHFVALKSDGTVWVWGKNNCGQLGTGNTISVKKPQKVTSVTNAIDIAWGYDGTYILKDDGTVWGCGNNLYGQLGDGTTANAYEFKQIDNLEEIIEIAAYNCNLYALKSDGTVYGTGNNVWGQLGNGTTTTSKYAIKIGMVSNIIQIATGYGRLQMLDADGSVWGVGYNPNGQLGNGSTTSVTTMIQATIGNGRVQEIATGEYHTIFLMDDGTVYTNGHNGYGQLGVTTPTVAPNKIDVLKDVKHVYAGTYSTYVTRKKSSTGETQGMYVTGRNKNGILFNNSTSNITTFVNVQNDKDISYVASENTDYDRESSTAAMVDSDGYVYTVGYNGNYEMGDETTVTKTTPTLISRETLEPENRIISIEKINDTAQIECNLKVEFNLLYDYKLNSNCTYTSLNTDVATVNESGVITAQSVGNTVIRIYDSVNDKYSSVRVKVLGEGNMALPKIAAGFNHFVALKSDGTVWVWGKNNCGQLGTGNTISVKKPQKVSSVANAIDVACTENGTYILKDDGTVWVCGGNTEGQLGDGTTTNVYEFKQMSNLENIIEIVAYRCNFYALKSDGTVYGTGKNIYGQIGDGTTTNSKYPTKMSKVSNIIQIAIGYSKLIMLDADGNLWGVGYNANGQLGDGTTNSVSIPIKVGIGNGKVQEIATGENHTVFLMDDATVYTVGKNEYGQIGNGTTTNTTVLNKIDTLEGVKHIYAGPYSTYITMKKSSADEPQGMYVVGLNKNGTLFNNSTSNITEFTNVQTDKDIINISNAIDSVISNSTAAMVDSDGYVYTVGNNENYEMGDETTVTKTTPTLITSEIIELTERTIKLEGINDTAKIECNVKSEFNLFNDDIVNTNCKYTSLNTNVASVSETGIVTAVAKGNTQVIVQNAYTGKESSVLVYVMGENDITIPQIESNSNSNIALKSNGEIWSYGYNANGELGTGDNIDKSVPTYTGINNIIQVAVGISHCVAVDSEGHVWTWGSNKNGELGIGEGIESNTKVQVKSPDGQGVLEDIVEVAAGNRFTMALDKNGNIYAWGNNDYGQLGLNNKVQTNLPVKVDGLENITDIHAKNLSAFAIDQNKKLWSCGYNGYGNLGLGNYTNKLIFTQVTTIENVASVKASETNTTYVTTTDGNIYGFGNSANCALLNATGSIPQKLSALDNHLQGIYETGAGYCTGYAITNQAKVLGWGLNNYMQLCNGNATTQSESVYLKDVDGKDFENAMLVSANSGSVQIARNDGTVWSAGYNNYGKLGDSTLQSKSALENIAPNYIKLDKNEVVMKLSSPQYKLNAQLAYGFNLLYEMDENSQFKYESSNEEVASVNASGVITAYNLGRTYITIKSSDLKYSKRVTIDVISEEKITKEKVVPGNGTTIALKQDGTVWTFGRNQCGQIGNGSANNQVVDEPTKIQNENIVDIAAGEMYNIAVDASGIVYAWGYNGYGQLGNGTTNNQYVPYKVENLNNIIKVETDLNKSYALSENGDVYAWGDGYGNVPQKIVFGKKVQQISNKIMLCEDGTIYTVAKQPKKVYGFNNIVEIDSNGNNYAALDRDGKVWTLGNNTYAQLGTEDTQSYNEPVQVKITNEIEQVKCGSNMLELLDVDGNVYTCGNNDLGKLGTGDSQSNSVLIKQTEAVQEIKTIASEYANTIATDKSGFVYITGNNQYKQLGNKQSNAYSLIFQPIKSTYVNVSTKNITLELNKTEQIKATLDYTFNLITDVADSTNIEYTSLNEEIVAVTPNGLILGKKVGIAQIIVTHTITGESTIIFVRVVPTEGNAIAKVVQGTNHTIALKTDGTVWSWGDNTYGQLGIDNVLTQPFPVQVPTLENVIDIVTGPSYTMCLKSDGTIWSFGKNEYGALGNATCISTTVPVQVVMREGCPLTKIVKVSTNEYKTSALDENGEVWNWGYGYNIYAVKNESFEKIIDVSSNYIVNANGEVIIISNGTKLKVSDILTVSEGLNHILLLSKNGKGYAYGSNDKGQLGLGTTTYANIPKLIMDSTGKKPLMGIKQLVAGRETSIAVLDTNDTYIWGTCENYKLCSNQTVNQLLPKKIENLESAMYCFTGGNNAGIIDLKGYVYSWGLGTYGNLGNKLFNSTSEPVLVGRKELDLNTNDIILHSNEEYQLTATNKTFNVIMETIENMKLVYTSGNPNIATVTENGKITGTNTGKATILATKVVEETDENTEVEQYQNIVNVTVVPENVNIEPMVKTADSHTLILKANGTVWAYGNNSKFALGTGSSESIDKPVQVLFSNTSGEEQVMIRQIATGNDHSLALDTNGNVWAWGINTSNSIGNTSKVPVKMNLNNIQKIVANNNQSMAISKDGYVYVWGYNANGELGVGTYKTVTAPTLVSYVNDVIDGDLGNNHSVLLTKNGKVFTTGLNIYGQTGKEIGKTNRFEEISIPEVITKVVAGDNHTILLSYDSNIYAMGYNNNGQLGNGTTENLNKPTKVMDKIMNISAGKDYTIVLTNDKNLYATGLNSNGELGTSKGNKNEFTKVEDIANVMNLDCGNTYSVAITYDGSVYGWGNYYHGIQKIRTVTNSTIPVKIGNDNSYTKTPEITVNINSIEQIEIEDSYLFNVFIEDYSTNVYRYESLNSEIATVDSEGKVKGISVGTTWIKVIDDDTNKVIVIIVKVIKEDGKVAPIVEGGEDYTVVLKSSGDIWGYGYNENGQLGLDSLNSTTIPNQVNILTSYKKVKAGEKFVVALREDGTVWAWGDNTYGQLGQRNRTSAQKPIQVQNLDSIIDIAVGNNHVIALDSSGSLYSWGLNSTGQLGTGDNVTVDIPTKVIGVGNNIIDIAAGGNTTAILDTTGKAYVFGSNANEVIAKYEYSYDKYGQKMLPATNKYFVKPQKIYGENNIVKIECYDDGFIILDSNQQVDKITKYASQSILNVTTIAQNMVDVVSKNRNIMGLDENKKAFSYGDNIYGQGGTGISSQEIGLTEIEIPNYTCDLDLECATIGCGNKNNYLIDKTGYVYSAGSNEFGQIGNGTYEQSKIFTITSDKDFDVTPATKIMEQPETEVLNIKEVLFNVYNYNNVSSLSNYTINSNNADVVSVEEGILSAKNTGEAIIAITNKLTGATKEILRVVQPLGEDRIQSIQLNGGSAELSGVKTYDVNVVANEEGKGSLIISAKDETDTILVGETLGVGRLTKEITLDILEQQIPITVTATNGNSVEYTLNVKVLSNDTTLSTIKIGETEAISVGQDSYEIIIDNTINKPEVTAIATSEKASIIIESKLPESMQSTKLINMTGKIKKVIPIMVMAESGEIKTYELTIYKEEALTVLNSLTINGVDAMKVNENTYRTTVKNDLEAATIVATALYHTAQININEDEQTVYTTEKAIQIAEDEVIVKIYVTSKNIDREITLIISKEKKLSELNILTVTANGLELRQIGETYIAPITANDTSVELVVTTKNEEDLVSIDGSELSVNVATKVIEVPIGENAIKTITVVDSTNASNTRDYTVNIKRPSSDASLKLVTVQNEAIQNEASIEQGTNIYKVGIPEEYNKINITAVANCELSKVSIQNSDFESNEQILEVNVLDNPTEILLQVVAEDGTIQEYKLCIIKQSNDATLNRITVEGVEVDVSEEIESGYELIYEYTLIQNTDLITVSAITNNQNASVRIDKNEKEKTETTKQINMVGNTSNIIIEVTAEDGTVKKYKLLVHSLSDNTNLRIIKVNGEEAENSATNRYISKVNKTAENFVMYIASEDEKAKIKVGDNEALQSAVTVIIPKNEELTTVGVTVISQSGVEEKYIVEVTNESDNCDVSAVKVDNEYGKLNEDGKYYLNVSALTDDVEIKVIPVNENSSVEINNINSKNVNVILESVENIINIKVTAEDGTSKDYELIINKLSNEVGVNIFVVYDSEMNNEDIYSIILDENGKGTIKIRDVDSTLIRVVTVDEKANIEMLGESEIMSTKDTIVTTLDESSMLPIKIIAEDGTIKQYEIELVKNSTKNELLKLEIEGVEDTDILRTGNNTFTALIPNTIQNANISVSASDLAQVQIGENEYSVENSSNKVIPITLEEQTIIINVKSEAGDVNAYELKLIQVADLSLTSIKVDEVEAIIEDKTYKSFVESTVESVSVQIVPANENVLVSTKVGTGGYTEPLASNSHAIEVLTTEKPTVLYIRVQDSEDATRVKEYILNIEEKSNDSEISKLEVNETNGIKTENAFNLELPMSTTIANIVVTPNNKYATVLIGTGSSQVGESKLEVSLGMEKTVTIPITITSQDKTSISTYNLVINRKSEDTSCEILVNSEGLDVVETNLETNEISYVKFISNETTSVDVTITANDELAMIEAGEQVATKMLTTTLATNEPETKLVVNITAESGNKETYNILIVKNSSDATLESIKVNESIVTQNNQGIYYANVIEETVEGENATVEQMIEIEATTTNARAKVKIDTDEFTQSKVVCTKTISAESKTVSFEITVQPQDESAPVSTYTLQINKISKNNNVKCVKSGDNQITEFNSQTNTYNYYVANDVTELPISIETENEYSTITYGENTATNIMNILNVNIGTDTEKILTFKVISESGEEHEYNIKVARVLSDNTVLDTVKIDEEALIQLEDGNYETTVKYSKNSVSLSAIADDLLASIRLDGETQINQISTNVILNKDSDTVKNIVVTAQDGSIKTYTITIHKMPNDLALKSIIVNNAEITEVEEDGTYKVVAPIGTTQTIIQVTTLVETSNIKIDNSEFVVKTVQSVKELTQEYNVVNIVVKNEDGEEATYKLVIEQAEALLSTDTTCEILVNDWIPEELDAEQGIYTKYVNCTEDEAIINVTTTNQNAKITINNQQKTHEIQATVAITGNVTEQQIIVESEKGTQKIYTLKLVKKSANVDIDSVIVNGEVLIENENGVYEIDVLSNNQTIQNIPIKITTVNEYASVKVSTSSSWYQHSLYTSVIMDSVNRTIELTILVQAQDQEQMPIEKSLIIHRISDDTGIESIKVNDEVVTTYDENTYTFTTQIKSNVQEISIVVESSSIYAKIVVDEQEAMAISTIGTIDVQNEEKITKTFKIVAENGNEQEYTLIVEKMSADCNLKHLYLNGEDTIQKFIDVEYVPTVNISIRKITEFANIEAEANNGYANIHIGDTEEGLGHILRTVQFNLNTNVISVPIVVTSQDGLYVKTYNIIFARLSNNTEIATLKVDENLVIPDENGNYETFIRASRIETEVNIELEDALASVELDSTSDTERLIKTIQIGENIQTVKQIKITANDGTERTATLTINKSINDLDLSKVYVNDRIAKQLSYNTYQIDIEKGTTSLNIRAIAEKTTEYISINDNVKTVATNTYSNFIVDGTIVKIKVIAVDNEGIIDEECEYSLVLHEVDEGKNLEDLIPEIKVDNIVVKQTENGKYYAVVSPDSDNVIVYVGANSETTMVKLTAGSVSPEYSYTYIEKNIGLAEDVTMVTVKTKNGAGTEKEYILYILKENEQNVNNGLEYLKSNSNIVEANENGMYEVIIKNISSVKLDVKAISEFSTVQILENGTVISKKVIGENGEELNNICTTSVDMGALTEKQIIVKVISVLGSEKSYIVNIVKVEELKLKELTVNSRLATKTTDTDYIIDVLRGTTQIDIKGILYNDLEYIKIAENKETQGENSNLQYDLASGKVITIVVATSLNNTDANYGEKIYTLTINEVDTIEELSDLQISISVNGNLLEETNDGIYIAQMDSNDEFAEVIATATSDSTKVKIGDSEYTIRFAEENISLNSKEVEIIISAKNGDNQIVEKRLWLIKQFDVNEDAGLKQLKANNSIVEPQEDGTYLIRVENTVTEVALEATAMQKLAYISINENTPLRGINTEIVDVNNSNISTWKIAIESVSGTIKEYTVIIDKNTYITGKIATDAMNQENQSARIIVYNSADTRLEDDEIAPREKVVEQLINPDGTYLIRLTEGTYDIVISKLSYSEYRITGIEVENGKDFELGDIRIYAGDVIKTGEIELMDLIQFNEYFMNMAKEKNKLYEEKIKYDLDENGVVNMLDKEILKSNYGRKSIELVWIKPE